MRSHSTSWWSRRPGTTGPPGRSTARSRARRARPGRSPWGRPTRARRPRRCGSCSSQAPGTCCFTPTPSLIRSVSPSDPLALRISFDAPCRRRSRRPAATASLAGKAGARRRTGAEPLATGHGGGNDGASAGASISSTGSPLPPGPLARPPTARGPRRRRPGRALARAALAEIRRSAGVPLRSASPREARPPSRTRAAGGVASFSSCGLSFRRALLQSLSSVGAGDRDRDLRPGHGGRRRAGLRLGDRDERLRGLGRRCRRSRRAGPPGPPPI